VFCKSLNRAKGNEILNDLIIFASNFLNKNLKDLDYIQLQEQIYFYYLVTHNWEIIECPCSFSSDFERGLEHCDALCFDARVTNRYTRGGRRGDSGADTPHFERCQGGGRQFIKIECAESSYFCKISSALLFSPSIRGIGRSTTKCAVGQKCL